MRTKVSLPDKSVTCCNCKKEKPSILDFQLTEKIGQNLERQNSPKNQHCTYNECVIEGSKNVSHTKNMFSIPYSWSKGYIFFLWFPDLPPRL